MDSSIGELFLHCIRSGEYNRLVKINLNRDGRIELIPRRFYGEGTGFLKPAGKSLLVSTTNLNYRRQIEYSPIYLPEYFQIVLCQGTMRGIGGAHVSNVYNRHTPAGFSHRSVGVLFLPEFFETFFGSRYGVSQGELLQALDALGRFPLIPDAAIILKQIGDASFTGAVGNVWLEAKTVELISIVLDWQRRLAAGPPLKEADRLGILEAIRYVEEHSSGTLTLDVLARQAAMSISKFTAAFRTHTGFSPAAYIRRVRMHKAMDLLKNTSAPLGDIAGMVGYKHQSRFSTLFREQFGVMPSEFRKVISRPAIPALD
jgi:AraC-like DNA-binding protein